ncbi:spermatogenesis-associated protein 5 [Copidosoma floridanum]|uniref:spermatogenesis-associated protein 5 n=1 Tax=Copidosoma floridanum TaxID=29053 RepID=UPI0006C99166|nr:spermatogenesis-associated protein 5 [Copidosoma floridanum]
MSPPKARKSITSLWMTCDRCQAILSQRDTAVHEKNCPPTEPFDHEFIKNGVLHSNIEAYKSTEFPKHVSQRDTNYMVFLSESAMQLCEIPIGNPVLVTNKDNVVVKTAWPLNDKTLTTVCLTKNAMELDKIEGPAKLERLKSSPFVANEIFIEPIGKNCIESMTTELNVMIKNYNHDKILAIGNRISIPYYGKKLIYKITNVETDEGLSDQLSRMNITQGHSPHKNVFIARYSTRWTIDTSEKERKTLKQNKHRLECVGGYKSLIKDLIDVLSIGLGKHGNLQDFHISRGVLLCGPPGVGKSMLSEALLAELRAFVVSLSSSDVHSKSSKDAEAVLTSKFNEAFENEPSIIFIEDIDNLCPKKNTSATDSERRVLVALSMLFDSLQNHENVVVLAVTSKPDLLDASLRRPGRIDKEFEMPVPTSQIRREIILKIIEKMPHSLSPGDVDDIAYDTHGFVGADLHGLASQAAMKAIKRKIHSPETDAEVMVSRGDFDYALTVVGPSAIKEVLIDVPNVKWSDIGGMENLKLKLKQSVEWPLKHADSFKTIGIAPPRGVLLYGPPGCSKTMIAKALATESKLNFLNIKGPELFSKWVGDSEKAVRDLFKKARQVAPSIIFIDEIDALGGERSTSSKSGGNSVQERVLTQLLTELDGVTSRGNVTLVAATNRPDRIDKALLRPGRFDRLIYVPLPDSFTRQKIFEVYFRKMAVSKEVDVNDLVYLTDGYSGAEIQAICNEAGMKALEDNVNAKEITKEHFAAALTLVNPRTHPDLLRIYECFERNKNS